MTHPNLTAEKVLLRKKQSQIRALAAAANPNAGAELARHAGDLIEGFGIKQGSVIAGFWPIRGELSPLTLMAELAALGMQTALPTTPAAGKPLIFRLWQEGEALAEGLYGTSEPLPHAPLCTPDLILVPLLAFDGLGYRLGYGGGFYDRSLAAIRQHKGAVRAVGVAFSEQQIETVPTAPHDARLDAVLTPQGLKESA